MFREYIIVKILGVIFLFIIIGCVNQQTVISGNIVTEKNKDALSKIELRLTIFKRNKVEETQRVEINSDGTFDTKVSKKGVIREGRLSIARVTQPPWIDPFISTELKTFKIKSNTEYKNIGNVYITDPIDINVPNNNRTYSKQDNILIDWEDFPFVDFYSISLIRIDDNKDKEDKLFLSTHNLKKSQFKYKDIVEYDLIERKVKPEKLLNMKPFNRKVKKLIAGKYEVIIDAYVYDETHDSMVRVGRSSERNKFIIEVRS